MKNKLTITKIIMPKIIIILLLFLIIIGTSNIFYGDKIFEEQEYKRLINIADSKALRVTDFLEQKKDDVVFLSELKNVKEIFEMDLEISEELMKEKIKIISEEIRDEIDDFLLRNPKMSVKDLQNSSEFKKIAVQRVGGTGYTFVYDYDAMINLFHSKEKFRGINYTLLKDDPGREGWWELTALTQYGEKELGGFVLWEEPDGSFKRKYKYTTITKTKTSDNIGLAIAATTYIDEYTGTVKLDEEISEEFISFQENKGYSDLIFIDLDGNIIWTAKENNELGTNIITGPYNESILSNVFNKAKKDLDVGVSDILTYGLREELSVFITSPVFDVDKNSEKIYVIGIVVLKIDNKKIQQLINEDIGLGEDGEVYIINKDYDHITYLKFDNHKNNDGSEAELSEYDEVVYSERIDKCFEDYSNYYLSLEGHNITAVENYGIYLNYANTPKMVLGAHSYVLGSRWCVIAENSYEEFKNRIPNENLFLVTILIAILIISFFTITILDYFLKIKRRNKK